VDRQLNITMVTGHWINRSRDISKARESYQQSCTSDQQLFVMNIHCTNTTQHYSNLI